MSIVAMFKSCVLDQARSSVVDAGATVALEILNFADVMCDCHVMRHVVFTLKHFGALVTSVLFKVSYTMHMRQVFLQVTSLSERL